MERIRTIASTSHHRMQLDPPIRVVVLGDTHLGRNRDWLPVELMEGIEGSDLILHTGDFSSGRAMNLFRRFKPVLAVRGNNDEPDLASELPDRLTLTVGPLTIEVIHGHRERGRTAKEAVIKAYAGHAELVIFGHSHRAYSEEVDGTWFLNPGSPTMKRWEPMFSYVLLNIEQDGSFRFHTECFERQTRPIVE